MYKFSMLCLCCLLASTYWFTCFTCSHVLFLTHSYTSLHFFLAYRTDSILFMPSTFLILNPLFGGTLFPFSFVFQFSFFFVHISRNIYMRWNCQNPITFFLMQTFVQNCRLLIDTCSQVLVLVLGMS